MRVERDKRSRWNAVSLKRKTKWGRKKREQRKDKRWTKRKNRRKKESDKLNSTFMSFITVMDEPEPVVVSDRAH